MPESWIGILAKNKKFLAIPNASTNIELVLNNFQLDISPIYLSKRVGLTSDKMRKFLREADFGLLDPSKPLSATNPPINQYTKVIADATLRITLIRIFNLYIWNESRKN